MTTTPDAVAVLTRLRDSDVEYLADRPDGHPDWRAAKEERIAALTAAIAALQAQGEVVAWQCRLIGSKHGLWTNLTADCADLIRCKPEFEIRELYALPPTPAGEKA